MTWEQATELYRQFCIWKWSLPNEWQVYRINQRAEGGKLEIAGHIPGLMDATYWFEHDEFEQWKKRQEGADS